MLDGASPGSGKYQAQTVSAPQHFQSEDGYPAVSGVFSIRLGRWPVQLLIFQSVRPVSPALAEPLRQAHTLSDVVRDRGQDFRYFFHFLRFP